MSKSTGLLIFLFGATVGSVITWRITDKKAQMKYERIAQEEINSVKAVYSKKEINGDDSSTVEARFNKVEEKPDISQYAEMIKKESYVPNDAELEESKPYVISPDEFGELDEYDTISLTYFEDEVLADDNNEKVDDVDAVVGIESLTRFGEYEDDAVFVRNDRLKTDYEILMDHRTYTEVLQKRPRKEEE